MIIFPNTTEYLSIKLSENFTAHEFRCKCFGCSFTFVDPIAIVLLQSLRTMYGRPITIYSAYRCQEHNASIEGKKYSYHLQGKAFDLPPDCAPIAKLLFPWYYEGDGFIHVDIRGL